MDNNLEPKNEYFAKKEEKEKISKEEQRKKFVNKSLWLLVILLIAGLVAWKSYSFLKKEAEKGPVPGEYFESQSREHIKVGAEHPAYNSNPPTGGWHYDQPAQTGIYDTELPDEQLVHNLEHSHIWIAYKPDLSADQIEKLADLAKDYGSKIIMTKRADNDSPIAFVAWEHLLKMDSLNEEQARRFIEEYRGLAGPEKLPDAGFKDFRSKK